ncbi:MAG: twin-arginine translocation signal domain-containing protein [Nitrospira sp.]
MNVDRRSLMKGLLAGGALLATGTPSWIFAASPVPKPERHALLLGGGPLDEAFAHGARAACASLAYDGLQIMQLKGGLLADEREIARLLKPNSGTRWITVMDDAGAIVYLEWARTVGARLLSMGAHACPTDGACRIRHDLTATSPDHSAGGLLASQAIHQAADFSIVERFLRESPAEMGRLTSWGAPGFTSHRFTGSEAIHLHCSGCSLADGCRLLDAESTEGWVQIPRPVCTAEPVAWRSQDWVESVGYAVTASALGAECVRESCVSRAFVRWAGHEQTIRPTGRFVSFVMDM